jgi:hypothetical protein
MEFRIQRDPTHPLDGTYTEPWASRSLSRTEITAGDYHRTEVIKEKKRWELKSASAMDNEISSAVNSIAYRIDRFPVDSKGVDKIIDKTSGSWQLRCILGRADGLGGRTELCFDKSEGEFAAESIAYFAPGGERIKKCVFQNFRKFGERSFPTSVQCHDHGETIEGKVTQLTSKVASDESIFARFPALKSSRPAMSSHSLLR